MESGGKPNLVLEVLLDHIGGHHRRRSIHNEEQSNDSPFITQQAITSFNNTNSDISEVAVKASTVQFESKSSHYKFIFIRMMILTPRF